VVGGREGLSVCVLNIKKYDYIPYSRRPHIIHTNQQCKISC
jgi:hypothetical protein